MSEVVDIPIHPDHAHEGAAIYIAVLAFPNKLELRARLLGAIVKYGRGIRINRDERRLLNKAERMICQRRIPSAFVAENLSILTTECRTGPFQVWTDLRNLSQNVEHIGEKLEFYAASRGETYPNTARENFFRNVWLDSLAVVPMATGYLHYAPPLSDVDLVSQCVNPEWLVPAIRNAEHFRTNVMPVVRDDYSAEQFVQLIPCSDAYSPAPD